MGRGHCLLNILAHEAAHRLLFPNRFANDFVGRWLLGFPDVPAVHRLPRVHFAHHRDEMGPDEPDTALYTGYPIRGRRGTASSAATRPARAPTRTSRDSARRPARACPTRSRSWSCSWPCSASSIAFGRPLAYVVWIASWCTLWKVSNRLRAIAEHGGMKRRRTVAGRRTWSARAGSPAHHRSLQHRLAPRPPRRHGHSLAQPAAVPRRARGVGLGHARHRVSVVPGVLAGVLGTPGNCVTGLP